MTAKSYCIGRQDGNDIVLGDDSVSRRHAQLTPTDDGRFLIEDLDSTNGTFIRDGHEWMPVSRAYLEKAGIVRIGDYSTTIRELLSEETIPGQGHKLAFAVNGAVRHTAPAIGPALRAPADGTDPAARIGIYPDRSMSVRPDPLPARSAWRGVLLWTVLSVAVLVLAGAGAAGYFYFDQIVSI